MGRLICVAGLLLLGACASATPREVRVSPGVGETPFECAERVVRVLFPILRIRDRERGWIISAPRFVGGRDERRVQAFARVVGRAGGPAQVRFWVRREVLVAGGFLGLFSRPGWREDGRDEEMEERLERLLSGGDAIRRQ